jgi:hypothetical protein
VPARQIYVSVIVRNNQIRFSSQRQKREEKERGVRKLKKFIKLHFSLFF